MGKEIIAFDLDDVVLPTVDIIHANYNDTYGTNLTGKDYYKRDPEALGVSHVDEAMLRFRKFLESEEFFNIRPNPEAVEVLSRLKDPYGLAAVTGRHSEMKDRTLNWLDEHLPGIFDECIFTDYFILGETGARVSKATVCKNLGAIALVEDHLVHAEEVAAVGIPVLLFGDYEWNQTEELFEGIKRVTNWPAVAEYFGV